MANKESEILQMMLKERQGKKSKEKGKPKEEPVVEETEEISDEPETEETEEPMEEGGFKYASEKVAKMMEEMGGEEETPGFETVELMVDGKPLAGNALVDFVLENQDAIRATDKESAMMDDDGEQ